MYEKKRYEKKGWTHMTTDIAIQMKIDASIEKIWKALTDSALLSEWTWKTNFVPIVGYKIEFQAIPTEWWDGVIRGNVLKVEKPHLLSYTWDSAGESTIVTFHLKKDSERKTQLFFEQSGFSEETKALKGTIIGAKEAWQTSLKKLQETVKKIE